MAWFKDELADGGVDTKDCELVYDGVRPVSPGSRVHLKSRDWNGNSSPVIPAKRWEASSMRPATT